MTCWILIILLSITIYSLQLSVADIDSLAEPVQINVPNGDFSEGNKLNGILRWEYQGPFHSNSLLSSAANRQKYFAPQLGKRDKCSLVLSKPLNLKPYHQYLLEMEVKGALFCDWKVDLIYNHKGVKDSIWPLWPEVHSKGLPPAPVWESRKFTFITPGNITGGRLRFSYEAKGLGISVPGLDNIRLYDYGQIKIIGKTKNLLGDPGFELRPAGGDICANQSAAHSGKQFYRIANVGWSYVSVGGVFLKAPSVIRMGIWARGKGIIIINSKGYSYGYLRLRDRLSPEFTLTDKWKYYSWEFPVALNYPEQKISQFWITAASQGQIDLDDADLRIISDQTRK